MKIVENNHALSKHSHEDKWNRHGSYKWTYFSEEVKQRVKFFLLQRLRGKNLDVGGGWHLLYPNSTVIDLSKICLDNNPAKEKVKFDLERIKYGEKLPFDSNSFNSATWVSVWQYLENPISVMKEVERVLKPGSEVYIINGRSGGLEECMKGTGNPEKIADILEANGYDTLLEDIPFQGNREFKSICVAMPSRDLFGPTPSRIENKQARIERNQEIIDDNYIFGRAFRDYEVQIMINLLSKLSEYPVTEFSMDFLRRAEEWSQEYNGKTGGRVLFLAQNETEPEVFMQRSDKDWFHTTKFFMDDEVTVKEDRSVIDELSVKHGIRCSTHGNYFYNDYSVSGLLNYCRMFKLERADTWRGTRGNENELRRLVEFLGSIPLNSFTKSLQERSYQELKPNLDDLDERIMKERAYAFRSLTYESKNERDIEKLIQRKKEILEKGIPIFEMRKWNFRKFIPYFRSRIR